MKRIIIFCLMSIFILFASQVILAGSVPPVGSIEDAVNPDKVYEFQDTVQLFSALFKNWKQLGPVGIGASIIFILISLMKSTFLGGIFHKLGTVWKHVILVVLGQAYSMLVFVTQGMEWWTAIWTGLITSGGAVLIWKAVKPLVKNVAEFQRLSGKKA